MCSGLSRYTNVNVSIVIGCWHQNGGDGCLHRPEVYHPSLESRIIARGVRGSVQHTWRMRVRSLNRPPSCAQCNHKLHACKSTRILWFLTSYMNRNDYSVCWGVSCLGKCDCIARWLFTQSHGGRFRKRVGILPRAAIGERCARTFQLRTRRKYVLFEKWNS